MYRAGPGPEHIYMQIFSYSNSAPYWQQAGLPHPAEIWSEDPFDVVNDRL